MSAEKREMLRHGLVKRAESADGVERKRKNRQRDRHQHGALDDVRHEDAPKSASSGVDQDDARAKRYARGKRNAEELRGDDAEGVEPDGIVEDAERNAAP